MYAILRVQILLPFLKNFEVLVLNDKFRPVFLQQLVSAINNRR